MNCQVYIVRDTSIKVVKWIRITLRRQGETLDHTQKTDPLEGEGERDREEGGRWERDEGDNARTGRGELGRRVGSLRVTMIETNWFSAGTAQRIYREYLELDVDTNGTIFMS